MSVQGYFADSHHKFINRTVLLSQTSQSFGIDKKTLFSKWLIKYSHILLKSKLVLLDD